MLPSEAVAKTSLPDRALIIDTALQGPPRSGSVQQSSGIDPCSGAATLHSDVAG